MISLHETQVRIRLQEEAQSHCHVPHQVMPAGTRIQGETLVSEGAQRTLNSLACLLETWKKRPQTGDHLLAIGIREFPYL